LMHADAMSGPALSLNATLDDVGNLTDQIAAAQGRQLGIELWWCVPGACYFAPV